MLAWLRALFQPKPSYPVRDLESLGAFIAAQGAFISQRATFDYIRARAGLMWQKLFEDERFKEALEYCRWEAYVAVLADIAEITQIFLRRRALPEQPLPEILAGLTRAALDRYPIPAHRESWEDAVEDIRTRLHRANLAAPRPVHAVGHVSGGRIFEILPLHTNLRQHDREHVVNNLRFMLVRYHVELEERAEVEPLRDSMLAAWTAMRTET